jgi:hypothetical protein
MNHHTEAFIEDGTRQIGWQCLTCGQEEAGFASIGAAERAANRHDEEEGP